MDSKNPSPSVPLEPQVDAIAPGSSTEEVKEDEGKEESKGLSKLCHISYAAS